MYQPEKLKERRVAQGLTQQELANALGVSKQAYSAWERGVKVPASDKVEQLEKLLSVPKGIFYRNRNCTTIPYAHAAKSREGGTLCPCACNRGTNAESGADEEETSRVSCVREDVGRDWGDDLQRPRLRYGLLR